MAIITAIFGEVFTDFDSIGILLFFIGIIAIIWYLLSLLENLIGRWGEYAARDNGLL